jgi:hypothetical protein
MFSFFNKVNLWLPLLLVEVILLTVYKRQLFPRIVSSNEPVNHIYPEKIYMISKKSPGIQNQFQLSSSSIQAAQTY